MKKEEIKKGNFLKNFKQTFKYVKKHKIRFIDDGKIIDEGTHEELLKRNKD